jgi:hypothetical protein
VDSKKKKKKRRAKKKKAEEQLEDSDEEAVQLAPAKVRYYRSEGVVSGAFTVRISRCSKQICSATAGWPTRFRSLSVCAPRSLH